jgi:hypothetical protein
MGALRPYCMPVLEGMELERDDIPSVRQREEARPVVA